MMMTASQGDETSQIEISSSTIETSDPSVRSICYQCGSPNNPNLDISYPVLGKDRYFCCYGCHAVAKTIVESGMEGYYQHRETVDGSQGPTEDLPEFLKNLTVYDNLEVQQSFVRPKKERLRTKWAFLGEPH